MNPADRRGSLPPIVAFSRITWGGLYNVVEPRLAGLASRGWRIAHSNGALSVWERDADRWASASWHGRFEPRDGVLLDQPGRYPPRWERWDWWDRRIVASQARRLRRAVGAAPGSPIIAYLFHPMFVSYLAALEPVRVVFQVIDNFAFQPGWTATEQAGLVALVDRADLILLNNESQLRLLPGKPLPRARVLGNAVDIARVEAGRAAPCPSDLAAIPAPRIGYSGMVNAKMDFPMIEAVARARPEWHWVIVGPIRRPERGDYPDIAAAWARTEHLPNVHFLGERHRDEVPAYLAWMDVNTMCYRLSAGAWTQAAYPFKVLECLGAGKPVVSAAMPEVMRHRDVMGFADTPAEWITAIDCALTGGGVGTPESRMAVAGANSWEIRIAQLDQVLREPVGPGGSAGEVRRDLP